MLCCPFTAGAGGAGGTAGKVTLGSVSVSAGTTYYIVVGEGGYKGADGAAGGAGGAGGNGPGAASGGAGAFSRLVCCVSQGWAGWCMCLWGVGVCVGGGGGGEGVFGEQVAQLALLETV